MKRRTAVRNGEESVFCSIALLRSSFISAHFCMTDVNQGKSQP